MVKKYLLRLFLFCSLLALFVNKASAQYASLGSAPNGTSTTTLNSGDLNLIKSVYWLTWGDVNPTYNGDASTLPVNGSTLVNVTTADGSTYTAGNVVNGTYTWLFSPTVKIIATITNRTFSGGASALSAYTPGTFYGDQTTQFGDQLDNLFNANGLTGTASRAVQNSAVGVRNGTVTFDVAIDVKIKVNGNFTSVNYPGMVIADGESIANAASGEYISAETAGATPLKFQLIAKSVESTDPNVNDYKLRIGSGGTSFKLFVSGPVGDLGVGAVMFAQGSKAFKNVSMLGSEFTAISIGFVLPFDLGDNPGTFGFTGQYINNFVIGQTFSNPGDYSIADPSYTTTPLVPSANVYIGSVKPDPDGQQVGSDASDIDNTNNINDENTLTPAAIAAMPVVNVNQSTGITISGFNATNTSLLPATLYQWLDLNSDGKYSGNEVKTYSVPAGSSNITVPDAALSYINNDIKNLLKTGPLHARYRITTDTLTNSNVSDATLADSRSTTYARDGEIEDYKLQDIVGVSVSGTIFHDGNGATGGITTSPGASPATFQKIAGQQLYAYLVNASDSVIINQATVASNGTFTLSNNNNGNYILAISTNNVTPNGILKLTDVGANLGNTAASSGASYGTNNGTHTAGEVQTGITPNLQIPVTIVAARAANVTGVNFGINLAPTAVDDPSATNGSNATVVIPVTNNDTDADGSVIVSTIQLVNPYNAGQRGSTYTISEGKYTANNNGTITFESNGGFVAGSQFNPSTIQYTIKDNLGLESAPATVTVTFTNKLTGTPDTYRTPINVNSTEAVKLNDGTLAQPDSVTVAIAAGPANGTILNISAAGVVTYKPNNNFLGTDTYTYTITNASIVSSPISVTVNIAPTGVADSTSTVIGNTTPLPVNVGINDGPSIQPGTTVTNITTPISGGTAVLSPGGTTTINYTPTANFVGKDSFFYKLTNGGVSSDSIKVIVSVSPKATPDEYTTAIGTASIDSVKNNDGPSGAAAGIIVASSNTSVPTVRGGTTSVSATGIVTYNPLAGYVGNDNYTYTLTTTDTLMSAAVNVLIHIKPVGQPDTYNTAFNTASQDTVISNDGPSGVAPGIILSIVTNGQHGQATLNAAGNGFVYQPANNFNGTDTYTYRLTTSTATGSVQSDPITVTVNTAAAGAGSPDAFTTNINTPVTYNVRANDGAANAAATVTVTGTSAKNGTISTASPTPAGSVLYTPAAGFTGLDTYTYTLTNGTTVGTPITVTVTVKPTGVTDSATTIIGNTTPLPINVGTNDGASATQAGNTVTNITIPANGTATLSPGTTIINYTPQAAFVGKDRFTYKLTTAASNGSISSDAVNVVVSVYPKGVGNSYITNIDIPRRDTVKANDGPSGVRAGIIVKTQSPTTVKGGTTVVDANGIISYTPPTHYVGVDGYTYTLTTADSLTSATINVIETVKPVGQPDTYNTAFNTASQDTVISNDGPSGVAPGIILSIVTNGQHGQATLNAAGNGFVYQPANNFNGTDTYTYRLTTSTATGSVQSDPITVTVNTAAAGAGSPDAFTTNINTPVTYNVRANDGAANAAATVTVTGTSAKNGTISTASPTPAGSVLYTPAAGFTGLDTYTYTLTNGTTVGTPITVTVTVLPVAVADSYTTPVNTPKTITDAKANDSPNDATVSLVLTSQVSSMGGQVSLSGNTFVYTPPSSTFTGTDTFTYNLKTADNVQSAPATVTITVTGSNAPTGVNDTYITPVNTASVQTVKANDGTAAQPNTVTVAVVTAPAHGTITGISPAGVVTYTPATDYIGTDAYTYTLTNAGVISAPVNVNITIMPTGVNDVYTTPVNTASTETVKANDGAAAQPNTVTVAVTTAPTHGTITGISTTGVITYTPTTNYVGADSYTYTLSANGATSAPITVTVNIKPTGVADTYSTPVNTASTEQVKSNDGTFAQPAAVVVTVTTAPAHGTITSISTAGVITYTPTTGFSGTDTYKYTLTSGGISSDEILVTVNITGNGTPDFDSTNMGFPVTTNVKANDGPTYANATVTATAGSHGLTSVDANGNVIYRPVAGFVGVDTYTYTLTANGTTTAPILVTINVKPVGTPDTGTTPVNTAITTDVKANDGAGVTGITVTATNGSNGITSVDAATGKVTYTPVGGFTGVDTYTYVLTTTNGNVASDPITVTITVTPATLTFTKVANNGFSKAGDIINYTFTITNNSNITLNNVIVTDAGVDAGSITPAIIASLAPNALATVTAKHTATQADVNAGTYSNQASLRATDIYGNAVNKPKSDDPGTTTPDDPTVVKATTSSLTFTKTALTTTYAKVGDIINYRFTITNTGNSVVNNVTITDAGVDAGSISPVTTASIAAGGSANVTARHTITQADVTAGTYSNQASVTGTDVNGNLVSKPKSDDPGTTAPDDPTVVKLIAPSLTFTKAANTLTYVKAGDVVNYTFTVTNTGIIPLNNIVITDAGADAGSITPASITTIAAGASATATARHTITQGDVTNGVYSNQASLTGTDGNGNTVIKPLSDDPSTTAPDDPTVVKAAAAPGISVVKTGVVSDTFITYNFVIRNTGGTVLTSVTLTDAKLGLTNTPINLPAGGLQPNIGAGYQAKYTLTQADIDAGSITNIASVTGTDAGGNLTSASTSVVNTAPKAPVAMPDNAVVGTNSATIIKVLNNDPIGDPIVPGTIEIVTPPKHGTVKVNADGTITYIPNPGYNGTDSFTYRGKDARGFYTNNAEVGINVGFIPAFTIPTLFTPNGDGVNDTFEIRNLSANYPDNELVIVNRWGNEVFRQTNYNSKWAGDGLNEGTYYYLLHIRNTDGSDIQVIKGWVTLLRSTK